MGKRKNKKIRYDIVDSELNADGEVKDEYFEKVLEKKFAKKKSEIQLAREEGKKIQKEKDAKKLQKK